MKNFITLKLYLSILLITCSLASNAQPFDSLLSRLNSQYKQEKLYLHFDRELYNPGETIWFKAYVFTGNHPSRISKTLYAELTDDKGKVLEQKIAPVIMSGAAAAFDLPANFTGSVVYVRAYTKWMLNFDSSFIFTKAIPVATLKKSTPVAVTSDLSLHIFPEGGDLIQGVNTRIAFKVTDKTGMPADISGEILDSKGSKLISFASVHDGMGSFELQPKSGESYKAVWKDKSGKAYETLLPAAKPNGLVLEVNNNSLQIEFKIKRAENGPALYPFVYVVVQMNQLMLYKAKANISKTAIASGIIPSDNFPAGIAQVTLFTPDNKPIAERITFINSSAISFNTDINAVVKDLGKRKKNVLQIDVPDTIASNLSISVTDFDLNPSATNDNIFSGVFLTSDIKGYVHNPAYYFSSHEDSVADHLDLVMMTNGWRRFKWENVLANRWPKIVHLPEDYVVIEGNVTGINKTQLANRELTGIIELKDKKREYITAPLKPEGRFAFPEMLFYDTARLFYQFNNDKKKELTTSATIQIKNQFLKNTLRIKPDSTLLISLTNPGVDVLSKNMEVYKEQLSATELEKVKILKDVVVTVKQKTKQQAMDEEYASGAFSGGNSRMILPEDDPSFLASPSLLDYLQGRIAGLQVDPTATENAINRRGQVISLFINEIPQQTISMITDGKIVEDASYLLTIPMSDIAMVKIYEPPFVAASGSGAGGAIAVYLKKGVTRYGVKGLDYVYVTGYSHVKEFYSPDYSRADQSSTADYRKTLYWSPFVITDKKNTRILLPFYNNDITKKIRVVIEGCNADGKLTRVEKVLQ